MRNPKIGQDVIWTHNPKQPDALKLTGRVEAISGSRATIRANNTLYDVHIHLLRSTRRCAVCGEPTKPGNFYYCSRTCYGKDMADGTDDLVFDAIVRYKTEHNGCSPSFLDITRLTTFDEASSRLSVDRLNEAGRIKVTGRNRSWQIEVPGGRWVYEGKS